jgi:hypothetical protein
MVTQYFHNSQEILLSYHIKLLSFYLFDIKLDFVDCYFKFNFYILAGLLLRVSCIQINKLISALVSIFHHNISVANTFSSWTNLILMHLLMIRTIF